MTLTIADRIVGCLQGIATGDAIGKQTEMLSHEDVAHGGSLAIAAAAATAAAVSAAIEGAPSEHVLGLAERAAAQVESRCPGAPAMANAIRAVHDDLTCLTVIRAEDVATRRFPNSPLTIVPLALGLATVLQSAEEAILLSANVGGDSDSVTSIAGAILGAMDPETVNQQWYEIVEGVNAHNLVALAEELGRVRH
jgi:ADP-ribosylglycohydrolase